MAIQEEAEYVPAGGDSPLGTAAKDAWEDELRARVARMLAEEPDRLAELIHGYYDSLNGGRTNGSQPTHELVWMTAKETCELEEKDLKFIAYPFAVPGIVTALAGEWKSAGKTTLLLAMSGAVMRGGLFLGQPTIKTPIVYLYEGPPAELKPSLLEAGLEESEDLHILYRGLNDNAQWSDTIAGATKKCVEVGARLLIVDTRAEWVEDPNDRENNSGFARASMKGFTAAQRNDIAVIVAAHPTKAGGTLTKMFAGSGQWAGAAGRLVGIWAYNDQNPMGDRRRIIEAQGRQGHGNNLIKSVIQWHPEEKRYTFEGPVEGAKDRDQEEEALNAFPIREEEAETFEACRSRTEMGKNKFRELIVRFLADGLLNKKTTTSQVGGQIVLYYRPEEEVLPDSQIP